MAIGLPYSIQPFYCAQHAPDHIQGAQDMLLRSLDMRPKILSETVHWRRKRGGGAGGMCPPPPPHTHTFESGGGGQRYVCTSPPNFQTQNLGLGIEPTDMWRHFGVACITVLGPSDVPPPHILSRSYAVAVYLQELEEVSLIACWRACEINSVPSKIDLGPIRWL